MTHDIEDLVRRAQLRRADHAVPPGRVLAALPRRARQVRRRRAGTAGALAAAVVAVTAAVAVPTVVLRPDEGGAGGAGGLRAGAPPAPAPATPPAVSPGVPPEKLGPPPFTPGPEPTHPPAIAPVPVRYGPTWLPAGLAERGRMSVLGAGGSVARTWTDRPLGPAGEVKGSRLTLDLRPAAGAQDPARNGGKPVTVRGVTGYYHQAGGKSYLEWRVDAGHVAALSQWGLGLGERDMLRVARSVRADDAVLASPLRFGSLPGGTEPGYVEVSGDFPRSWHYRYEIAATLHEGKGAGVMSVEFGTGTTAPDGGETLTVGDRPARLVSRNLVSGARMLHLVVDLAPGRLLTVTSEVVGREHLVAVAGSVRVGQPDLDWLGERG